MTFEHELHELIQKSAKPQKTIAYEFREQMKAIDPSFSLTDSTIASHLSRLKNARDAGVRFFVERPERLRLLFEIIGVPAPEHDRLLTAANLLISDDDVQPLLVVDVTPWSGLGAELPHLMKAVERQLLIGGLSPVALIVTEAQDEWITRRDMEGLQVVKVGSKDEARIKACALAGDRALLATSYGPLPAEQWLALEYLERRLVLEPANALETYAQFGRLDRLAPVMHPITDVVPDDLESTPPLSAVEQRRMMDALQDESRAAELGNPAHRLGLARRLGVEATSTAAERHEKELERLIALCASPVASLSPEAFANELERARRRPTAVIVRVDDALHAINPPGGVPDTFLKSPLVSVHKVDAPVPAITRVFEATTGWTRDDFLDDPVLDRVVEKLARDDEDRLFLQHAAATLIARSAFTLVDSPPARDWRAALVAVVKEDLPLVGFIFRGEKQTPIASAETYQRTIPVVPVADARFLPSSQLAAVTLVSDHHSLFALPARETEATDVDAWLEAVDASGAVVKQPSRHTSAVKQRYQAFDRDFSSLERVGTDAQITVTQMLLLIRASVKRDAVVLPDGRVFLPLGGRLAAQARFYERPEGRGERHVSLVVPTTVTRGRDRYSSGFSVHLQAWRQRAREAANASPVESSVLYPTPVSRPLVVPTLLRLEAPGFVGEFEFVEDNVLELLEPRGQRRFADDYDQDRSDDYPDDDD